MLSVVSPPPRVDPDSHVVRGVASAPQLNSLKAELRRHLEGLRDTFDEPQRANNNHECRSP